MARAGARQEGGLDPDQAVEFRVYRPGSALLGGAGMALSLQAPRMRLPEPVEAALGEVLPPPLLLPGESGLWTVAPFHLEVR